MNGLYPIIRRVRRPLLPVDPPADAKPLNVPVAVVAEAVTKVGAVAVVADAVDGVGPAAVVSRAVDGVGAVAVVGAALNGDVNGPGSSEALRKAASGKRTRKTP